MQTIKYHDRVQPKNITRKEELNEAVTRGYGYIYIRMCPDLKSLRMSPLFPMNRLRCWQQHFCRLFWNSGKANTAPNLTVLNL